MDLNPMEAVVGRPAGSAGYAVSGNDWQGQSCVLDNTNSFDDAKPDDDVLFYFLFEVIAFVPCARCLRCLDD